MVDQVSNECLKSGMRVSQFVCHHWMEDFSIASRILSPIEPSQYAAELDLAAKFPGCTQVTVPLARFVLDSMETNPVEMYRNVYGRLVEHIHQVLKLAKERSLRVALELQPGACISGIEGFLRVWNLLSDVSLGYNFDTGHANASKEQVEIIPLILGDRIFGTHLCDNHGNENLSLAPGDGSIDWAKLLGALNEIGYRGSYDLEILCPTGEVEAAYLRGLNHLRGKF
jgi:sugar phosphate isomerase/epimerase